MEREGERQRETGRVNYGERQRKLWKETEKDRERQRRCGIKKINKDESSIGAVKKKNNI